MTDSVLPADPTWRPIRATPPGLARRFGLDPSQIGPNQAWQLLYEKEPALYDRLTEGEALHPGLFRELRLDGATVLDVGAGAGRLTLPCAALAARVLAVEPVAAMRDLLTRKLGQRRLSNVTVLEGRAQALPLATGSVDVTVSAAAFGADGELGGEVGLRELRRVTRRGGEIFILWPDDPQWFLARGFQYQALGGRMEIRFRDLETAELCAAICYESPLADWFRQTRRPMVPFEMLGVNPPRDMCRCRVA